MNIIELVIILSMSVLLFRRVVFRSSFVAKMSENIKRAQRLQEGIEANKYAIEHEAKVRQKVTIESSVEALENEMREEIARALKNSESKILYFIKNTEQRWKELEGVKATQPQIQQYNNLVTLCEKARWEFMVHRQAVGFTIRNYEMVTTLYKIPPKIAQE